MLLPNRDPRIGEMSILSDRIDNARLTEGVFLYLVSVGLVAAAIIVLFSVASFSLLGTSKEMLTEAHIDNNPVEDVSIGAVVSYRDGNAAPIPVQTKSPSSSGANNLPSSTLVPPPSGMSGEGTTVEPAFKPLPHGETSAMAVETRPGSTRGPSTDETAPPEPSGSQQVIAQPLSSAAETGAAAVQTTHGSPRGPSIDETPSPEMSGSRELIAPPLSLDSETSAAQHASGATMPWVATFDGEPDQNSQNFEIQSNHHGDLDEGSVAFRPESRLPETQVKETEGYSGSAARTGSNLRLLHAASGGLRAVKANRDKIADQLNHAELSRLLGGGRAHRR
jgi:hypothetical protein